MDPAHRQFLQEIQDEVSIDRPVLSTVLSLYITPNITPGGHIEDEGDFSAFYNLPNNVDPAHRQFLQEIQDEVSIDRPVLSTVLSLYITPSYNPRRSYRGRRGFLRLL